MTSANPEGAIAVCTAILSFLLSFRFGLKGAFPERNSTTLNEASVIHFIDSIMTTGQSYSPELSAFNPPSHRGLAYHTIAGNVFYFDPFLHGLLNLRTVVRS
jgi:hypothetical protein